MVIARIPHAGNNAEIIAAARSNTQFHDGSAKQMAPANSMPMIPTSANGTLRIASASAVHATSYRVFLSGYITVTSLFQIGKVIGCTLSDTHILSQKSHLEN